MAAGNNTNNILKQILVELDAVLTLQKAQASAAKSTNVPKSNIGNININSNNTKAAADALNSFAGSMLVLKQISKKDVDNAVNMIDLICSSFSKIRIKKEDIDGLGEAMDAFAKMHGMIDKIGTSFLKIPIKFNSVKGWMMGWTLGGFYKSFMASFEKRLSIKELTDKFQGQNMGANLSGLSELTKTLLSFDWKQLLKVGIAWKHFPSKAGENIAQFFEPIINVIKKMPKALANSKTSKALFKESTETTYVTNPKISGFLEVLRALTSVTVGQVIKLSMMGLLLNGKKGTKVGQYFGNFVKEITKPGVKKTEAAANIVRSITLMFVSLTLCLVLVTATVAIAGWDKTLIGLGILTLLVAGSMLIIKVLSKQEIKKGAKESLYTVGAISLLFTALTLNLLILTAMVKNNKPEDIGLGLLILGILVGASLLVIKQLTKIPVSKLKGAHKAIGMIALMMVAMTGIALLSVLVGKLFTDAILGSVLVVALAFTGVMILKMLSKLPATKMKQALKAIETITLMMVAMTGIALLAVLIGKNIGPALLGSLLVVALAFTGFAILKKLSKMPKTKLKEALHAVAAITLMMIAMAGIALLSVLVGKQAKEAVVGVLLVAGLAFAGMMIFKKLAKMKKQQIKNGIFSVIAIAALFFVLSYILRDYIAPAMKIIDSISAKGIAVGLGTMTAMCVGGIAMIKVLSKMSKTKLKKGVIAAEGIALVMLTISKALQLFGKFLESINKVKGEDIAIGSAIMVGMIVAIGAAAFAAGALVSGPQAVLYVAGVAALEGIAVVIASLSGALLLFAKLIKTVNKSLTVDSIENATNMIVGSGSSKGMVGCILDIVSGLEKIGVIASIKIGIISRNLNPLFFGLSKFVDVIQKMATMKMLDHYDEKGKPIYTRMRPGDFTKAAVNLSVSFATFLKKLNEAFVDGPTAAKMFIIIKALTKGGIIDLMKALSLFTDSIVKLVGLQVPDEWDKDGKPKHYKKLKKSDFKKAAVNLSTAFATFLVELKKQLGAQSVLIGWAIKNLTGKDGGLKSLMDAVCSSVEPFVKFASGKLKIGDYVYNTDYNTMVKGAKALAIPMAWLLQKMSNMYFKISKIRIRYVCDCIDILNRTLKTIGEFSKNADELVKGSDILFKWLNTANISKEKMKIYAQSMNYLGKSLNKNHRIFKTAPRYINDIAKAIRNLDDAIIKRNNDRVKAIDMMCESFGHLNDNLGKLNKEMNEAMKMADLFNKMKDANEKNFIINAVSYVGQVTKDVGERVEKIASQNQSNKTISNKPADSKKPQNENNPEVLIAAFIEALNKWNAEHKDLTLELSGKGAIALGTIYGNR